MTNENGTCYPANECAIRGGVAGGSCASGFGVCCTCKLSSWYEIQFDCEKKTTNKQEKNLIIQAFANKEDKSCWFVKVLESRFKELVNDWLQFHTRVDKRPARTIHTFPTTTIRRLLMEISSASWQSTKCRTIFVNWGMALSRNH